MRKQLFLLILGFCYVSTNLMAFDMSDDPNELESIIKVNENKSVTIADTRYDLSDDNEIDRLFFALKEKSSDISFESDKDIFEKLKIYKVDFNEEKIYFDKALEYYSAKIEFYLNQDISSEDIFKAFSKLDRNIRSRLNDSFSELLFSVSLKLKDSEDMHLFFNDLLKDFIKNNNTVDINGNEYFFKSSEVNAIWIIQKMKNESDISYQGYLEQLSPYYKLFDMDFGKYKKSKLLEFVEDRFLNVTKMLLDTFIDKFNSKPIRIDDLDVNNIHFYLKIYINKALINRRLRPIFFSNLVSKSFERNSFDDEFINSLLLDASKTRINNNFIKDYYQVELLRHVLELNAFRDGVVEEADSVSVDLYDLLFKKLIESLNYVYDKTATAQGVRLPKVKGSIFKELEAEYRAVEKGSLVYKFCEKEESCEKSFVKPGIYSSYLGEEFLDTKIYAKELIFSPLSMIYTGGKEVYIMANKLENIWVDSSGRDGKTRSIPNSKNQVARPSFQNFIHKKHRDGRWSYTIENKKVVHPQPQPKSENGTDAGLIHISFRENAEFVTMPLLVSRGGHGGNGADGLPAAFSKKDKVKHVVVPKRKYDERYNMRVSKVRPNVKVDGANIKEYLIKENECKVKFEVLTGYQESFQGANPAGYTDEPFIYRNNFFKKKIFKIKKGKAGNGGDAGNSKKSIINRSQDSTPWLLNLRIFPPGRAGTGGKASDCGDGKKVHFNGKNGEKGEIE